MKEHRQENNHIEKGLCRLGRYKFGQKIAHADNRGLAKWGQKC